MMSGRPNRSDNDDLFKNVQDLRRRLQMTEQSLFHLHECDPDPNRGSPGPVFTTPEKAGKGMHRGAVTEDSKEIQDILSADGSYQAIERRREIYSQTIERQITPTPMTSFQQPQQLGHYASRGQSYTSHKEPITSQPYAAHQVPRKQPFASKPGLNTSQRSRTKHVRAADVSCDLANTRDASFSSGGSGSRSHDSRGRHGNYKGVDEVSAGQAQTAVQIARRSPVEFVSLASSKSYDPGEELRKKIQRTRDENAQMLRHNHQLLSQLEDLTFKHHKLQEENESLRNELGENPEVAADLKEQVISLQSQSDSQEKALRDTEDRCEILNRDIVASETLLKEYQTELEDLRNDLQGANAVVQRVERERDKTLHTAEQLKLQYEEYQRKTRGQIVQFESNEIKYTAQLKHLSEERESLLKNAESSRAAILNFQQQLREFEDELRIERESRADAEAHNSQLRSAVADLQRHKTKMDNELRSSEGLRRENDSLRASVQEHKQKLHHCQITIGESQAELKRLEEIARKFQAQSKSRSKDQSDENKEDLNGSYLETIDDIPPSKVDALQQLQSELECRNSEIRSLRALVERQQIDRSSHGKELSLSDLSLKDAHSLRERHSQAEHRIEELEALLLRLEEERTSHLAEIATLQEKLTDLDIEVKGQDSKLQHRNSQVVELQKELNEKINQVSTLEREVRKKSSQIASVERQLDDKVAELSEHVTHAADAEADVAAKTALLCQTKKELEEKERELVQNQSMLAKTKALHGEQCQELEKQIQQLEKRFQEKDKTIKELHSAIASLKTNLSERDEEIRRMNTLAKQEISRKIEENECVLRQWEERARESMAKVHKLEAALLMCKEELNVYLEQYESTKRSHDLELAAKEKQIEDTERHRDEARRMTRVKEEQIRELEQSAEERVTMLQQSAERLTELEDGQTAMQQRVYELEQALQAEQSRLAEQRLAADEELRSLESKLQQAIAETEQRNVNIHDQQKRISALELAKEAMSRDMSQLEAELGQEKVDVENKMAALREKDQEIGSLKRQIMDKEDEVKENEERVRSAKDECDEKAREIGEMQTKYTALQMEFQGLSNQLAETQQEVDSLNVELEDKKKLLEQHKLTIRRREDESRSKSQEIEGMERELEQRNWQIQQRAAQLTQLEMTVKEHKSDMEQKVIRVEGQLHKANLDLEQKQKQISDLEARIGQGQGEIQDKSIQLQQTEQALRRLRHENEDKSSQIHDLEMQIYTLRHRLETCITESSEVGHELKTAREDAKKMHHELTETRRELSLSRREQEKWRNEHSTLLIQYQDSELQLKSLSEQLGQSRIRGEQLESKTDAEMRKLVKEVDSMRQRHQEEIKEFQNKLLIQNEAEEKLREKLRELEKADDMLSEELDRCQKEASQWRGRVQEAQMLVTELQGKLALKEAEIARLQGRLHGLQRSSVTSQRSFETANAPQANFLQSMHAPSAGLQARPPSSHSEALTVLASQPEHPVPGIPGSQISQGHGKGQGQATSADERSSLAQFASSKDDSIISLLDRMKLHEEHVNDILRDRLSVEPQREGAGVETLVLPSVPDQLANPALQQDPHPDVNPFRLFQGEDSALAQKPETEKMDLPTCDEDTSRVYHAHTVVSSSPKPEVNLDSLSSSDLADVLAKDPNSFQAMLQKLKESYAGLDSQNLTRFSAQLQSDTREDDYFAIRGNSNVAVHSLVAVMQDLQRMSGSVDVTEHVVSALTSQISDTSLGNAPPRLPLDDDVTNESTNNNMAAEASPDDSTISVITESESLSSYRLGLEKSDISSKQFTSSPKVTKSKPILPKNTRVSKGNTALGQKLPLNKTAKPAAGKISKKSAGSTGTSFFGAGSKKAAKSSNGAKKSSATSRVQSSSSTAPVSTAKSPGEQSTSPNVSTAIAHYASDLNQSEHSPSAEPAHSVPVKGQSTNEDEDLDPEKCMALLQARRRALEARKKDLNSQILAAEAELSLKSLPGSK